MGNFFVLLMVLLAIGAFMLAVKLMIGNYRKVGTNEALVVFGRKHKRTVTGPDGRSQIVVDGFRVISGGAAFVWPIIESCKTMLTGAHQSKVTVSKVVTAKGVPVTVEAVATFKIDTEESMLYEAAKRLLDLTSEEIEQMTREILEGGLRGVVATMEVEALIKDRSAFASKVQNEVAEDLARLGIRIDNFVIQDITDAEGYIEALGKQKTSEIKRDAEIGKAEATRDQEIRVAVAIQEAAEKSSSALQIGEIAKAGSRRAISDAERLRDIQIAQNTAQVQAEQARIPIAAEVAEAEMSQKLKVAQVQAEQARIVAETELQQKNQSLKEAQLQVEVITPAKRAADAKVITAEGDRLAAEKLGEAALIKATKDGDAAKATQAALAEGRKSMAAAIQRELEAQAAGEQAKLIAQAEGDKARLLAEAEGIKAKLTAEAEGVKAKLLAEAEGVLKKAEAYGQLDQSGKFMFILEKLPQIIDALGKAIHEAGMGTFAPMAQAIGNGLAGVDEVRIIQLGPDGNKSGALGQFSNQVPDIIFNLLQKSNAMGLMPIIEQVFSRAGIDLDLLKNPTLAASTEGTPKNVEPPTPHVSDPASPESTPKP